MVQSGMRFDGVTVVMENHGNGHTDGDLSVYFREPEILALGYLLERTMTMDKQKLDYFRNLLLEQRRQAVEDMQADQTDALVERDGVVDSAEEAKLDETKATAFELGDRQYHLIDEIDDALQRIEDGTYGQCARCGKPISEERLKAMPTARYDAECQAAIEARRGDETPSL